MKIKNKKQLKEYKEVCDLSVQILRDIKNYIEIGKTTLEIDKYAEGLCKKHNVMSAFKGVSVGNAPAYEYTTCISLNDTVVHGIPDENKIKGGDIIKVDFGIIKNGYYTDHCFTIGMKPLSNASKTFISKSQKAVLNGLNAAIIDNRVGDIGHAIQSYAEESGYSIAKNFVGHSIGRALHEYPDVPAFGEPNTGEKLEKGLVLCIEAQIIEGKDDVYIEDDQWTVKTKDRSNACMFEYIVIVDKNRPKILTDTTDFILYKS